MQSAGGVRTLLVVQDGAPVSDLPEDAPLMPDDEPVFLWRPGLDTDAPIRFSIAD